MKKKIQIKYEGFTMIEMLITMAILAVIFLAVGNVLSTMIKTSNTVSSRMLVREEGEFMAEIFRKYIRNSSADNVKLYYRGDAVMVFDDENYVVDGLSGTAIPLNLEDISSEQFATEIHFRPSADAANKVVCIGFFYDCEVCDRGHIVRSVTTFSGSWDLEYHPDECFPPSASGQDFIKNFVTLNSDLVYVSGLEIRKDSTHTNVYYTIDIDMEPSWGTGGMSNYRDREGTPRYRKSFVVQTRQLFHW